MAASNFLLNVLHNKHVVATDLERQIERQYWNCIEKTRNNSGNELLKSWFKEAVAKLFRSFPGKLQHRHQRELKKLKFDHSDWPFVATCSKTVSKKLVSEDSDYTGEVKQYLKSQLAVDVLSIQDSLNEFTT